jgi:hypothetical protein
VARLSRPVAALALILSLRASAALAAEDVAAGEAAPEPVAVVDSVETWKVERAKVKEPKLPTLRFLEENRDFFRARLDALLLTSDYRTLGGRDLDPRFLRYREMMAEIRAARDSAAAGEARIEQHELLDSVEGIAELERDMDSMEKLLAAQHERLSWLEEDFVGRQTTALIVFLSGVPSLGAPHTVVVQDVDGATYRIELAPPARQALARGGDAELLHERFEPRDHLLLVSFEGYGWRSAQPVRVMLSPPRDQLTFLEIDASRYDPAAPEGVLATKSWTR